MCGICGIFNYSEPKPPADPALIKAMMNAMRSRGPDDEGAHIQGGLGLGFRRLSIVDLAGGHQPLSDENGSLWLVLNGEIYNYPQLKKELLARGHKFKTASDAEAVLHLYQDHGPELLHKLEGMFAFALWDSAGHRLMLARDRTGIKPLYYHDDGKRLIFGSSLASILTDPSVKKDISLSAFSDFLALRYVPSPDTAIEGIKKLEPGHLLLSDAKGIIIKRYWSIPARLPRLPETEARELLKKQLLKSIGSHLMSDVPVAAFLSGGIDSSIVVGAMVKLGARPKTFTAGFEGDPLFDELPFAKKVADHWGLENFQAQVSAADVQQHVADIARALEEPIADPAAIPGYFLSQMAARQVKVVLTGEGADETFAGYRRYWWALERNRRLKALSSLGSGPARLVDKMGFNFYRHRSLKLLTEPKLSTAYLENIALFNLKERRALAGPALNDLMASRPYPRQPEELFNDLSDLEPIDQLQYADTSYWLPDDLLIKMDKITMAHSLEARVPFLDNDLMTLAWQVSGSLRNKNGITKYLLREISRDLLPAEILKRPKQGFDLPLARWFRGPLGDFARQTIMESRIVKERWINPVVAEEYLKQHSAQKHDRSFQIYALMFWGLWEQGIRG
ncbi:MAG: asparagine synthase (glutamine-hydrolyzing) [bacterium]|nr:asparagine synthase (glutamine-hydrolyzing) [bacterium]